MTIKVGDHIPSVVLFHKTNEGIIKINSSELFSGKKVVLFALPGAFTPTCSQSHLPGYVVNADKILEQGIDTIICLSVNDPHVMKTWGEQNNVEDKILMISDGNGDFTRALGLEIDRTESGMGFRSQRYAMVIDDAVVIKLNLEKSGQFEVSDANTILDYLNSL